MEVETACNNCQSRLLIAARWANQPVRCPRCDQPFVAKVIGDSPAEASITEGQPPETPASQQQAGRPHDGLDAAPSSLPERQGQAAENPQGTDQPQPDAATSAEQTRWILRLPEGQDFGPVDRSLLDSWVREGRVTHDCRLRADDEDSEWQYAVEVYAELDESGNPFASVAPTDMSRTLPHRGGRLFILALVGCLVPFLSLWPAVLGHRDLNEMQAKRMDDRGEMLTRASHAISLVATMIWTIALAIATLVLLVYWMSGI